MSKGEENSYKSSFSQIAFGHNLSIEILFLKIFCQWRRAANQELSLGFGFSAATLVKDQVNISILQLMLVVQLLCSWDWDILFGSL